MDRHFSGPSRREAIGWLSAVALAGAAKAQAPLCGAGSDAADGATAQLLGLLPEGALRAGIAGIDAARCDDQSPDGDTAIALAVAAVLPRLPAGCDDGVRRLLERWRASADVGYGRNDPLAAIHRPYRVTAYAGPHLDTVEALALYQPLDTPAATDAWLAKLDGLADALLATGQALRADEAAGCVPPVATGRAALAVMDGFTQPAAADHPLVAALRARGGDETAAARAAALLARRVQPATASLRDTLAVLTRRGRADPGVWALPKGELLHAANFARAGDTTLALEAAQGLAREEVARVAALLDRRLAARGLRTGPLAERVAAAFAERPGLLAGDDADGRAALAAAARDRIEAAHALLPKLLPPALAAVAPPRVASLPGMGRATRAGSFYLPAGEGREATLWLDDRSVYALPVPGVAPIALHLGLPGQHLLAEAGRTAAWPALVAAARWPAFTAGWGCYAERLAAEAGLFARDPWGDIARLSDELLRAARLVVDVGIHAQRWPRAQAERAMTEMTGAAQGAAIDRIVAMPGEAASWTLGLDRLLTLRDAARKAAGRRFDPRAFHAAVLTGGPRPFAAVPGAA